MEVCAGSMFCGVVLGFLSSLAIIMLEIRELSHGVNSTQTQNNFIQLRLRSIRGVFIIYCNIG